MDKNDLRAEYTRIRNSFSNELRTEYSSQIADRLFKTEMYKNAECIFVYVSAKSEVETHLIIDRMLADGKRVSVPLCDVKSHTMQAVEIKSRSELTASHYGILEPVENGNAVEITDIDLCIVPALAFDKRRMRLGYGGGYYDRFLADFGGVSAGLAFEECIAESLPFEEYDRAVDFVITPQRIIGQER